MAVNERRLELIMAQLRHTNKLVNVAVTEGLGLLSDDRLDYLKGALLLAHDLVEEFTDGSRVPTTALRTLYASDGVCPELRKLAGDE